MNVWWHFAEVHSLIFPMFGDDMFFHIAMEHGPFIEVYLLKMLIFHGYNQMVADFDIPTVLNDFL